MYLSASGKTGAGGVTVVVGAFRGIELKRFRFFVGENGSDPGEVASEVMVHLEEKWLPNKETQTMKKTSKIFGSSCIVLCHLDV